MDYTNMDGGQMDIRLEIDKESMMPIYRQITRQITEMVQAGILSPGQRLPAERTLSQQLGIARGTIKKAFMELARNNIIEMTQGRGSFISADHEIQPESRKEQALGVIDHALDTLGQLRFSEREIQNLIQLVMLDRRAKAQEVSIATVDCNPESLEIFHRQLRFISNVSIHDYLLDELPEGKNAEETLGVYDLVLTTTTHYAELCGLLPSLRERIIQAAVAPSHQTIIDIASISENSKVGIICESRIFEKIIKSRLTSLGIRVGDIRTLRYEKLARGELLNFVSDKDILIIPPDGESRLDTWMSDLQQFTSTGGSLIHFVYQIERGSLIHIEEQISRVFEKKRVL